MRVAKRMLSILLLGVFLCVAVATMCFAAGSVPKSVIKASKSVLRIISEYDDSFGLGSGFIIGKREDCTYVATNYHVVEDRPISIVVVAEDGGEVRASVAASDRKKDLAILRVQSSDLGTPLHLQFSGLDRGDEVYAVGFPSAADYISDELAYANEDATITSGIVSSIRKGTTLGNADVTFIQMTAAINPGNSGGPLFNEDGDVVGVNTYVAEDAQGIYWSISIEQIEPLAQQLDIDLSAPQADGWLLTIVFAIATLALLIVVVVVVKKRRSIKRKPVKEGLESVTGSAEESPVGDKLSEKCDAPFRAADAAEGLPRRPAMLYCKKCGSRIVPNAKYCNRCGTPLQ